MGLAILGPSPSYEYPFNQLLYVEVLVAEQVRGVNHLDNGERSKNEVKTKVMKMRMYSAM